MNRISLLMRVPVQEGGSWTYGRAVLLAVMFAAVVLEGTLPVRHQNWADHAVACLVYPFAIFVLFHWLWVLDPGKFPEEPGPDWEAIELEREREAQREWDAKSYREQCWLYYPPPALLLLLPILFILYRCMVPAVIPASGPSLVLASNDGPLGIMSSRWMSEAIREGPGAAKWQDTWWLGSDDGSVPISISYLIAWLLYHPEFLIPLCLLTWCAFLGWVIYYRPRRRRKAARRDRYD